jgi:hypothetical protein
MFYIYNLLSLRYVPCMIYFYFPLSFSSKKKKKKKKKKQVYYFIHFLLSINTLADTGSVVSVATMTPVSNQCPLLLNSVTHDVSDVIINLSWMSVPSTTETPSSTMVIHPSILVLVLAILSNSLFCQADPLLNKCIWRCSLQKWHLFLLRKFLKLY